MLSRRVALRSGVGAALFTLALGSPLRAQAPLVVADPGPGEAGKILEQTLGRPYIRRYEQWNTRFHRDSVYDTTVVVLLSDATVASVVHGDVVVIDGNLYLQPGARIDGKAVAIGGSVYGSAQAQNRQSLSFPDVIYDTTSTPTGIALRYRYPTPKAPLLDSVEFLTLPYWLWWPLYDRVNGVSFTVGPQLTFAHEQYRVTPTLTYRSNLGQVDMGLRASAGFQGGWSAVVSAARLTATNDDWIQTNIANSVTTFFNGADYRNWWRAIRFDGRAIRTFTTSGRQESLWAGMRTESDNSVNGGGPWSIWGENDSTRMLRFNPAIDNGQLTTALVGGNAIWNDTSLTASVSLELEPVLSAPDDRHFVQGTFTGHLSFPTFSSSLGQQRLRLLAHGVFTIGDSALRQRYAYIGGAGSMPTQPILAQGGGQLVYLGGDYDFPIDVLRIPFLGSPTLTLREMIGSAGVTGLPRLETNTGVRLTIFPVSLDFFVNPANGNYALFFNFSIVR